MAYLYRAKMKYCYISKYSSAPRGFVLLIVLFFMQIYTLLGIYSLTSSYRIVKMNRFLWEREINLWKANQTLHEVERKIAISTPALCTVPIMPTSDMVGKTVSWWNQMACNGQAEKHYYYVVENLGIDPCVIIKNSNNQLIRAEYYRITLLYLLTKRGDRRLLLQSTIVRENKEASSSCNGTIHQVILGH